MDYLLPDGRYRPAAGASLVAPALPTALLTDAAFLGAAGAGAPEGNAGLFHVESGRWLDGGCLGDCQLAAFDTVIVVNCDQPPAASLLGLRWVTAGGSARRALSGPRRVDAVA